MGPPLPAIHNSGLSQSLATSDLNPAFISHHLQRLHRQPSPGSLFSVSSTTIVSLFRAIFHFHQVSSFHHHSAPISHHLIPPPCSHLLRFHRHQPLNSWHFLHLTSSYHYQQRPFYLHLQSSPAPIFSVSPSCLYLSLSPTLILLLHVYLPPFSITICLSIRPQSCLYIPRSHHLQPQAASSWSSSDHRYHPFTLLSPYLRCAALARLDVTNCRGRWNSTWPSLESTSL